jgi:hypothetical protein
MVGEPLETVVGQRIGAYRITGMIGLGGMGAVYRAVRDNDQYQKQVAIKLVKWGMGDKEVWWSDFGTSGRFWRIWSIRGLGGYWMGGHGGGDAVL